MNAAGERVYARERFAEPGDWAVLGTARTAATRTTPALLFSQENGLYHDAANWYLPDRRTVVTQDPMHRGCFRWGRLDAAAGEWRPRGCRSTVPPGHGCTAAPASDTKDEGD